MITVTTNRDICHYTWTASVAVLAMSHAASCRQQLVTVNGISGLSELSPRHMLFEVCRRSYRSYPRSYSHLAVSEFRHINDWSATNKLLINLSKTKEMIICRPGNRAKPTFPKPITSIEQIHTYYQTSGRHLLWQSLICFPHWQYAVLCISAFLSP